MNRAQVGAPLRLTGLDEQTQAANLRGSTTLSVRVAAIGALALSGALASVVAQASPLESQGDPASMADATWIILSGTIKTAAADAFVLDYGAGVIVVEMDSADGGARGAALNRNDDVTVLGRIDADAFEAVSIEAAAVHVAGVDTPFVASSIDDEEELRLASSLAASEDRNTVSVIGHVKTVSDTTFTLDNDRFPLVVDVSQLEIDLSDAAGSFQIEPDDRVRVSGSVGHDWLHRRELVADSIAIVNK